MPAVASVNRMIFTSALARRMIRFVRTSAVVRTARSRAPPGPRPVPPALIAPATRPLGAIIACVDAGCCSGDRDRPRNDSSIVDRLAINGLDR